MTLGDPRGVGPEVVRAALRDPRLGQEADFVIVGPEAGSLSAGEFPKRLTVSRTTIPV